MQQEQAKTLIVNIATVAILVGVVIAGYFVFFKSDLAPTVIPTPFSEVNKSSATIGDEIESTIQNLKKLNSTVASSKIILELPAFNNLQDYSVSIPEEPISRENPFVPTAWKIKLKAIEDSVAKTSSSKSNNAVQELPITPTPSLSETQQVTPTVGAEDAGI